MPIAPVILAAAAASGASAAIGAAVASAIGVATVSSVTAIAIGTGVISGGMALLQGQNASNVLKAAVVGGATSFIGGSIAQQISSDVFFQAISNDFSGTTSLVLGEAIGQGVGGALQGGLTAIAYDQDPIDAIVKNGLTAGLTGGARAYLDRALVDVPGFKSTDDPAELTAQRAIKSAIAAGLTGGDVGESVKLSLMTSAGGSLGTYLRTNLVDASGPVRTSSKNLSDSYNAISTNLSEQKEYVDRYNEIADVIRPYQNAVTEAADNVNSWKAIYDKASELGMTDPAVADLLNAKGYEWDNRSRAYQNRAYERYLQANGYDTFDDNGDPARMINVQRDENGNPKIGYYEYRVYGEDGWTGIDTAYGPIPIDINTRVGYETAPQPQDIPGMTGWAYTISNVNALAGTVNNLYDKFVKENDKFNSFYEPYKPQLIDLSNSLDKLKTEYSKLETNFTNARTKFEEDFNKFQTQELANSAEAYEAARNIDEVKKLYKQATGKEATDDVILDYLPKPHYIGPTIAGYEDRTTIDRLVQEINARRENPNFNAAIYREMYGADGDTPALDYLQRGGINSGLIASDEELQREYKQQENRLLDQIAKVAGLDNASQLSPESKRLAQERISEEFQPNVNGLKGLQSVNLESWNDISSLGIKKSDVEPEAPAKEITKEEINQIITDTPISGTISEKEASDVISDVIKDNPQIPAEDIKDLISDAVSNLPENPTADDFQNAIEDVLEEPSPEPEEVKEELTDRVDQYKEEGLEETDALNQALNDLSDDLNITNDELLDLIKEPVAEEPVAEEPVAEEPVAEEPVAEEPVAEEPVTEEPVIEEPVIEEPVIEEPVIEEPVTEEPVAEEPVTEEPVTEEPVAEEPVAEEPVAEEPVAEEPVAEEPIVPSVDPKQGLIDLIKEYEEAGLARDQALDAALDDLAGQLGTTREDLLDQLGQTRESLSQEFGKALTGTKQELTDLISKYEEAGLERDQALDAALDDLAGQLGTTREDLLDQLGQTRESLSQEFGKALTGTKQELTDLIGKYEEAGLKRDQALDAALDDLAGQLGTTREDLLGQLGQTRESLSQEFGTQLGEVREQLGNIESAILNRVNQYEEAGVERDKALEYALQDIAEQLSISVTDLQNKLYGTQEATEEGQEQLRKELKAIQDMLGRPSTEVTEEDIAALTDIINQEPSKSSSKDLLYDFNNDGKIDAKDLEEAKAPGAAWKPTGIYAHIVRSQQQNQQAQQQAQQQAEQQAQQQADQFRQFTQQQNQQAAQAQQLAQQQSQANSLFNLLSQASDVRGQQVEVKTPEAAKIGYTYDWSSIFANPQQEKMFMTPYVKGGRVMTLADEINEIFGR